jgi:tripartite-type tricarboxylate transporter receptor subunit TctC
MLEPSANVAAAAPSEVETPVHCASRRMACGGMINDVIREPDFAKNFAAFGYEMVGGSVEDFSAFLKDDIERYRRLTQAAGIAPE